jgi:predicted RecB family nuclease
VREVDVLDSIQEGVAMSEFLTVPEVAAALGLSPSKVRSLIRNDKAWFPVERVGSRYRIPAEYFGAMRESSRPAVALFRGLLRRIRERDTPYVDRAIMSILRDHPAIAGDLLRLAEVGSRVTRDRASHEHRVWKHAEDSLVDAWTAVGLSGPNSARFAALTRDPPTLVARIEPPTGATKRPVRTADRRDWVSKTELLRYVRCPYSFWLLDRGEIAFEDTVDEFQQRLLHEGIEFQRLVESRALRVRVEANEFPAVVGEDVVLLGAPGFRNEKLKIVGQPDGIDTALGELLPIEIKSHRDVRRRDELELAFYWLLLDPYRTVPTSNPRGFLILRREGAPEKVEVAIRPHRLQEVRRLLQEVRAARRHGVRARICGCFVCSQLRREEVLQVAWSRKDLTLIFGIGRPYAAALEEMGVSDYEALLSHEPDALVSGLRERGYFVSAATVESWQRHAQSWTNQAPVYFGKGPFFEGDSFIALDLEYDPLEGLIWLLGTCIVRGERRDHEALWADDRSTEKRNLRELASLLKVNDGLPIVTWNGE